MWNAETDRRSTQLSWYKLVEKKILTLASFCFFFSSKREKNQLLTQTLIFFIMFIYKSFKRYHLCIYLSKWFKHLYLIIISYSSSRCCSNKMVKATALKLNSCRFVFNKMFFFSLNKFHKQIYYETIIQ